MEQKANIAGNGNSVVQIVGDGNIVVTGYAHLTLTRFLARRQIRQDLDRLSPYSRSTPLLGRESELASLRTFLNDSRPMLARVLIGGGGSGKTRLALELCEQASADNWNAGFITRTELHRFFAQQNLSDWGWQKPTLIVVDYAAEHAELLGKWLDELTDRAAPPKHVMRLLLLERHASTETGWWTTVFASGGWGATSKRAMLDPPEPVTIRPLMNGEDRLALLNDMVMRASSDGAVGVPVEDAGFREKLMRLSWGGDPLFLMMAALAMVRVGHAKALTLSRTDLADALAEREADRLQKLAKYHALDPTLVQHLAACVTLAQGTSREEFERFAAAEKVAINRPSGGDAGTLADVLQEALPRPNGIASVLPDLIGEALIMRTLRIQTSPQAEVRCYKAFGRPVAETVIRCVQDFSQLSCAPLHWLNQIVELLSNDRTELDAFKESLPFASVPLADVNLRVAEQLYSFSLSLDDLNSQSRAATAHYLAGTRIRNGHHESALQAAQEAAASYRELAIKQPQLFLPELAEALYTLATCMNNVGRSESALRIAQEALDLRRRLAKERPDIFRPALAFSLDQLAHQLSSLGWREAALRTSWEAVDLGRILADERPDGFRGDLAESLKNLAIYLGALGHREQALEKVEESVDLRRTLAAERPDIYKRDLASSLGNLAVQLCELGQYEDALRITQDSVELYRALAAEQPTFFQPDLAMSLVDLANRLTEVGRPELSLRAAQEAVEIYRSLYDGQNDRFQLCLARSLNTLSNSLSDLARYDEALTVGKEAVQLYRALALTRPDLCRCDLAMSLNNLSNRYGDANQRNAASEAGREAVQLFRALAIERPKVFRPELAIALNNFATKLGKTNHHEAAVQIAEEAIQIQRDLAVERPDVFRCDLAMSLNNLSNRLSDIGRKEEALQTAREAVEVFRALDTERAGVFRADLATSIENLARRLYESAHRPAALNISMEAVKLRRSLATERPQVHQVGLAISLMYHSRRVCDALGAPAAVPVAHEAVAKLSPFFLVHPDVSINLMREVCTEYLGLCASARKEADVILLKPFMQYLEPIETQKPRGSVLLLRINEGWGRFKSALSHLPVVAKRKAGHRR